MENKDHEPEKCGEHYVLNTGQAGAWRLNLLNEVYGLSTEKLLIDIGMKPKMSVKKRYEELSTQLMRVIAT